MLGENLLLYLGLIFLLAFYNKSFCKKFNIPEVTGYVLLGVLFGISVLKLFNNEILEGFEYLSSIALGMIAFTIGIELKFDVIKKLGKSIIFIVIMESFGAFFVVFFTLTFLSKMEIINNMQIYKSILLAAVAAATAPAATVAVIRQYKAKGTLSSTILAVVGIDDAVALIIYVFASSFAKSLIKGTDVHILEVTYNAVVLVFYAFVIGTIAAFLLIFLLRKIKSTEMIRILLAAFIMILLGLCETLHISELLAIMVFGVLITNFSPVIGKKSISFVESLTPMFLAAFFILGGAHLDVMAIKKIGFVGIIYFIARSIGKVGGASLGAILGKAPDKIKKYIGFALLPQVGVALALALSIKKDFTLPIYNTIKMYNGMGKGEELAYIVINILLFTTIITEVIGPMLTKIVLKKAGEIE